MKATCSIFALLVYTTSTCALASLSEPTIIKVEATYKNSKKQVGYIETWYDINCQPSKNSKTSGLEVDEYEPNRETWKKLKRTDLIKLLRSPDKKIYVYQKIIKLNYFPEASKKQLRSSNEELRLSQWAWSSEHQVVETKNIVKLSVLSCHHLNQVAPILDFISDKEAKRLSSPALAMFTDEVYPEGVVSLISYNPKFDSFDKLDKLLSEFSEKYPAFPDTPQPDTGSLRLFSIYQHEKEFRKDFLPEGVILLIYHIQD